MKTGKRINRILVWAVTACTLAGIAGCYDDSGIRARLEEQERRLAALDQACARMNENIASLQSILNALRQNNYVSDVNPVMEAGKLVGYALVFADGSTVTLYHGTNGVDGTDGRDGGNGTDAVVPVVGVRQDADGEWYWTLNGEWLLDGNGNKVKAVGSDGADGEDGQDGSDGADGKDGKDGKNGKNGKNGRDGRNGTDGITPLLKIVEGYWYLSLDGGQNWTCLGESAGADGSNGTDGTDGSDGTDGDTIFSSITQDADNVFITLSDGTVITVPRVHPLSISFWTEEAGFYADTLVLPLMYDCLNLHYVVSSPTNEIVVQTVTSGDMGAYVIPDAEKPLEGVIRIKTDDRLNVDLETGQLLSKVLVIVANKTCTILHTLVCQESKLVRVDNNHVRIRSEGGKLDFHYQTNTPVKISIPDSAATWCWQVRTKAQLADSTVSVHFEPNKGAKLRRTSVTVSNYFGVGSPAEISFYIDQEADDDAIVFADSGLKQYLVDNPKVNLNRDSEISKAEAASVQSLETLFGTGLTEGRSYRRFKEFQYFTGITKIPDGSFNDWTQLDSIKLPESITTIGGGRNGDAGIFQNCYALKSIEGKFTQDNAIVYNNQLLRVAPAVVYDGQFIPDGVVIIGNKAVTHSRTSDLFIPSSVRKIRDKAFEHSAIERVRFAMSTEDPETGVAYVDSLAENAFSHCYKLKKFIGAHVNGKVKVCADDRVLYRDDTVYAYALGSSENKVIIPDDKGIKRLADSVFEMVSPEGDPLPEEQCKLEVIALPTGITHIGARTFYSQAALQSLYFHGSVVPIECGAQALEGVQSDMWVYIPAGASVDDFASKLNYNQVATWETWSP